MNIEKTGICFDFTISLGSDLDLTKGISHSDRDNPKSLKFSGKYHVPHLFIINDLSVIYVLIDLGKVYRNKDANYQGL